MIAYFMQRLRLKQSPSGSRSACDIAMRAFRACIVGTLHDADIHSALHAPRAAVRSAMTAGAAGAAMPRVRPAAAT